MVFPVVLERNFPDLADMNRACVAIQVNLYCIFEFKFDISNNKVKFIFNKNIMLVSPRNVNTVHRLFKAYSEF